MELDDIHANFDSKVYSFDGRRLRLAGGISGTEAIVKGDGTILEESWRGFWTSTDTFRLSRKHRLVKVPRRYYAVNQKAAVTRSLPLHAGPGRSRLSATLKARTKVTVVKSDLKGWYLVRAASGTQGWAAQQELIEHTDGLHVGD